MASLVLTACAQEQRAQPPAPPHPAVQGNIKSVSTADIRSVLALTRKRLIQQYGSAPPIYSVRVVDRNHIEIHYWADGTETGSFAERVKGKWTLTEEIERTTITKATLPLD